MELKYCCTNMQNWLDHKCDQHDNPFDCPDNLICYIRKYDEFGIIIHDGGSSYVSIGYCPWCGVKLAESKRDMWFHELKAMGFDDPYRQEIPEEYHSDAWYRNKER